MINIISSSRIPFMERGGVLSTNMEWFILCFVLYIHFKLLWIVVFIFYWRKPIFFTLELTLIAWKIFQVQNEQKQGYLLYVIPIIFHFVWIFQNNKSLVHVYWEGFHGPYIAGQMASIKFCYIVRSFSCGFEKSG